VLDEEQQQQRQAGQPLPPPKVGDWAEATQTLDAAAVGAFAALTHDHNAIHTDATAARASPLAAAEGAVAHGLLVAAAIPAVFGQAFPGAVYRSQDLQFRLPVPVGATVTTRVVVERVRVLRGGGGGVLVRCDTRCLLHDDGGGDGRGGGGGGGGGGGEDNVRKVVIEGSAQVLVPSLSSAAAGD
jgi:acyl dehydratase